LVGTLLPSPTCGRGELPLQTNPASFLNAFYPRPSQLFEKRSAKEKKLQLQRKPRLLANLTPDGKIGAHHFSEPDEILCSAELGEQIGEFFTRACLFMALYFRKDRVVWVDQVGAVQGVLIDGGQERFRLPALENPAGCRAVRIDGATVAFFGKEQTGPATPLPADLEQLDGHRLKPGSRRVVAHLSLPDGDQLIVVDIPLADKVEILPA